MKPLLFATCMLLGSSLYGSVKKPAEQQPPPFDADLFRKDEQVVTPSVEFLYWMVDEGSLDYALTMQNSAWGPVSYAQGNYETASFNLDPGFRLGFSFFRASRFWEVKWIYTRMECDGSDTTYKPDPTTQYLTGTWPQIFTNPLSRATSRTHLYYNTFDMLIDRVFLPNPHLRLRLLGGATVAWMHQDWKVRYYDTTSFSTTIRNRWRFIGGGLKIGTMIDWFWTENIYATFLGTTGALMGTYKNSALQKTNFQPDDSYDTATPVRDATLRDARPAFTAQVVIGPSWQKNFAHNRVEVFAGYELNVWLNLQEIYRSTSGSPSAAKETWLSTSMLSLQGLTTRLTVDF